MSLDILVSDDSIIVRHGEGQVMKFKGSDLTLRTERLGPPPLVNHVLRRLGLEALLAESVPTTDQRQHVQHAKALGVLVRSVLVEREPIYRQQ